jgi:hypothetical protein
MLPRRRHSAVCRFGVQWSLVTVYPGVETVGAKFVHAACSAARHPEDGVNLACNTKLFGLDGQLASIMANTLKRWPNADRAPQRITAGASKEKPTAQLPACAP